MEIKMEILGNWKDVYREALITEGKIRKQNKEPRNSWKKNISLAEHSPIRRVSYRIVFSGIKYRTAMHIRTHNVGVTYSDVLHYVSTQRDDRTADTTPRDEKPQGALVMMVMIVNAQSIINISRKRLCSKADPDTREVWKAVVVKLKEIDEIIASVCVKECLYRGFCPERKSCGYTSTSNFINKLLKYRYKGDEDGWEKDELKTKECSQHKESSVQSREQKTEKQRNTEEKTRKKATKTARKIG